MWLLSDEGHVQLKEARALKVAFTAEQVSALVDGERAAGPTRNLRVAGSVAEIRVDGVLTKRPDFLLKLFVGNTTYASIIDALEAARVDASVSAPSTSTSRKRSPVDAETEPLRCASSPSTGAAPSFSQTMRSGAE